MSDTKDFIFNQTMMRIRDPEKSLAFYRDVLGMTLLNKFDFPEMSFSLYFLAYQDPGEIPTDPLGKAEFVFKQKATLELTHNWGTESDANFSGYHNGNADPRGFGHIGITVPDVYRACARFEELGGFDYHQACTSTRQTRIVAVVPITGEAIRCCVLTHWCDRNAVT